MSFRRQRQSSQELRIYREFCRDNYELIDKVGLPLSVVEDHDHFLYFLMHGDTWPHADVPFYLVDLTSLQRQNYLILLDKYFEAGLSNPGLGGVTYQEQENLRRKHPHHLFP